MHHVFRIADTLNSLPYSVGLTCNVNSFINFLQSEPMFIEGMLTFLTNARTLKVVHFMSVVSPRDTNTLWTTVLSTFLVLSYSEAKTGHIISSRCSSWTTMFLLCQEAHSKTRLCQNVKLLTIFISPVFILVMRKVSFMHYDHHTFSCNYQSQISFHEDIFKCLTGLFRATCRAFHVLERWNNSNVCVWIAKLN